MHGLAWMGCFIRVEPLEESHYFRLRKRRKTGLLFVSCCFSHLLLSQRQLQHPAACVSAPTRRSDAQFYLQEGGLVLKSELSLSCQLVYGIQPGVLRSHEKQVRFKSSCCAEPCCLQVLYGTSLSIES